MQLTVLAKRVIPNFKTRLLLRRAVFFPYDVMDLLTGKHDPLVPPRGLWFVGGGHFRDNQFLSSFIDLCDLQPDHRVLDVGCGIGKQAVPMTRYLNSKGSYDGFDIVHEGVQWCERQITSRFPSFRFREVDVYNKHYNPDGGALASHLRFPYSDAEFDFACVISVFTHMLPDAVQNYLNEIGRVLKPNGKSFMSFFILNNVSRTSITQGRSAIPLIHDRLDYAILDPKFPETAVGLAEDLVLKSYDRAGLAVSSIHYGSWCGRQDASFYQDVVISVRK